MVERVRQLIAQPVADAVTEGVLNSKFNLRSSLRLAFFCRIGEKPRLGVSGDTALLRLFLALLLLALACLMAGGFGMAHNLVTFSISPEYFTKFKFEQFRIGGDVTPRVGAAIVGWHASWWMGILIGGILIPCGLLIRDSKLYFVWMLRVFVLVLITTAMFGLVALMVSRFTVTDRNAGPLVVFDHMISDPAAFRRAAAIHGASYLGGFVGVFVGLFSILKRFLLEETGSAKL